MRQVTKRKLKSMKGVSAKDIDFKIGHVEHKVKNRDLVLDAIENRLMRLEGADKKKRDE